ncbi:hypothetical protein [uncultured Sneathiella sp.]|jgi:hypothetical protein|uniref:hypothetical protein n=1 Tax=uncultured Sneathiella sp. TaxID=879315 RepID=UPI0030EF5BC6|tara:strand:+ start:48417 stop:48827 length:411 start_codon:yes stop_codon:yes gene_type:complete
MANELSSEEWWDAHYRERVLGYLKSERHFTMSEIRRNFGRDVDRDRLDRVIQSLIDDGTLREKARRYFRQKDPEPTIRARTIAKQTRKEFAAKSEGEIDAISAAGDLRRQTSDAAEKRRQRRMGRRRLPSLGEPCR